MTELWLVRHGESTANIAADYAERNGLEVLAVEHRDPDVPLSEVGVEQATALGKWLRENRAEGRPAGVWVSSYLRARQTVEIALATAEAELPMRIDERLRDRELGIFDLHTTRGIEARHPGEAARRRWLGKFYYRPPEGESWADVALRVRSVLRDLDDGHDGQVVLVAAHDAVVMLFLYVCLQWSELELLDFTRTNTVTNASVTSLVRAADTGVWELAAFSSDEHLRAHDAPVTEHAGDKDADIH